MMHTASPSDLFPFSHVTKMADASWRNSLITSMPIRGLTLVTAMTQKTITVEKKTKKNKFAKLTSSKTLCFLKKILVCL